MRLAVIFEYGRDGLACPFLDQVVHVDKGLTEASGEYLANGRLTGAHEADKYDVRSSSCHMVLPVGGLHWSFRHWPAVAHV